MKNNILIFTIVVSCIGFSFTTPTQAQAQVFELYTLEGFVEALIERGIIVQDRQEKARDMVRIIERISKAKHSAVGAMNADKVSVDVSQLIEHANGRYAHRSDIEGIVLLVHNTTSAPVTLEAKRRCQVVYTVKDKDDAVVYDSATQAHCGTGEKVTYVLNGGQTRIFEIVHKRNEKSLERGTYTFEVTYPGYGSGTRNIEVY